MDHFPNTDKLDALLDSLGDNAELLVIYASAYPVIVETIHDIGHYAGKPGIMLYKQLVELLADGMTEVAESLAKDPQKVADVLSFISPTVQADPLRN